ncbi:MAG: DUF1206 domain-containing protein [Pacificimonas sp.]
MTTAAESRITQLQTFAKIGYLARGIVYMLLGYFALTTANSSGTTGVLDQIKDMPLGTVLLVLVGVGLAGYGVFRLYGAMIGIEPDAQSTKGKAKRVGHAASGLAHLFLGYYALSEALGGGSSTSGGGSTEGQAASTLASMPGGTVLLAAVGICFLLAALSQGKKAFTGDFMRLLDPDAPTRAKYIGQAGYAARAVIFAVLGWTIVSKALSENASEVGGIGQVLNNLRDTGWLYIAVALGLIMFGVFSLVMARYRTIHDEDVVERLKAEVRA